MMTVREQIGKNQIYRKLAQEGYPTYAELFSLFDLHLTEDPEVVGFMDTEEAEITINENLDIEQVSVVIRHEILHEFLEHAKRTRALGDELSKISNIAADFEISNLGYTEADKAAVKNLSLGDRTVAGLVTELDRPGWENMTFEEMYKLLKKESPESLKDPQIGNRGNKQIQEAEAAARRAEKIKEKASNSEDEAEKELGEGGSGSEDEESQEEGDGSSGSNSDERKEKKSRGKYDDEEYKNMSPEEKKKERARRRKEAAKKLKESADELIDEIKKVMGEPNSKDQTESGGPALDQEVFDTPEEKADKEARLKKIKEVLGDLEKASKAKEESNRAILSEKAVKAAKDLDSYRSSPLTKFTESLNKFIRDSLARQRNDSWAHINKKYLNSGLLRPGTTWSGRGNVPLINVYFDRSGSWDKPEKTSLGKQAVATLNRYAIRGEIKIKLYYFNTKVLDQDPGGTGGTRGEPIMQHILQTKPNNVIIITDSDIADIRTDVTVDGGVWLLFYRDSSGGRSQNLIDHLHGKRLTKIFDIES